MPSTGPKTYEVRLTEPAESDIEAAHAWLSMQVSIEYADRWQDGLFADLERLAFHPTKFAIARESDIFEIDVRGMLYSVRPGVTERDR